MNKYCNIKKKKQEFSIQFHGDLNTTLWMDDNRSLNTPKYYGKCGHNAIRDSINSWHTQTAFKWPQFSALFQTLFSKQNTLYQTNAGTCGFLTTLSVIWPCNEMCNITALVIIIKCWCFLKIYASHLNALIDTWINWLNYRLLTTAISSAIKPVPHIIFRNMR